MKLSLHSLTQAALLIALLTVCLPFTAAAQTGRLDRSFGGNGRVTTSALPLKTNLFDRRYEGVRIDTGSDGSIIVAHHNTILRYLDNGSLDMRFGIDGRLAISHANGLPFELTDVALDSRGMVWAFGSARDPSVSVRLEGYYSATVNPTFAVAIRFDASGQVDSSFGVHGVFQDDLGTELRGRHALPLVRVASAKLDSRDRAVLSISTFGLPPSEGHSHFGWITDTVARLTSAGDLDHGFGENGIARGVLNRAWFYSNSCISPDDKLVIASGKFEVLSKYEGSNPYKVKNAGSMLMRLQGDGSLDPTFGVNGLRYLRGGAGPLACSRSGSITMLQKPAVVYPNVQPYLGVVRITTDGHVRRRYGFRGRVAIRQPKASLTALTPGSKGAVLLSGTLYPRQAGRASLGSRFTATRLLGSGRLDRRFGHRGRISTGLGRGANFGAVEANVDRFGRLLLVGLGRAPWLKPGGIAMARYHLTR